MQLTINGEACTCAEGLTVAALLRERECLANRILLELNADFGRLEYCIEAIEECGLTPDDLWFPSMSVRRDRPDIIYNRF